MRFSSLILTCLGTALLAPSETRIASLIEALSDPDPARRTESAGELRRLGGYARPALVAAARSENSAIATAASELLLGMSWYRSDDPPALRTALARYGRTDPMQRIEDLYDIASKYPQSVANQALIRLLLEEPDEDVCWQIVSLLRRRMDAATTESLRAVDLSQNRASAMVLAARACFLSDRERAYRLLRRAIDVEKQRPTLDAEEMNFAFDALVGAAIRAGQFDDAASIRREQSARAVVLEDSNDRAVDRLFALHARYGPLEGYEKDIQTYSQFLADPQILYALGMAYRRGGMELGAQVCMQVAAASSLTSQRREPVARFLRQNHFDELAEVELRAIVAGKEPAGVLHRIRANFELAEIAARQSRDAEAAAHLQTALGLIETFGLKLEVVDGLGQRAPLDVGLMRARIEWRRFRAAGAGGRPDAAAHLSRLLAINSCNTEMIADLTPYLRSIGREEDARRLFEREYNRMVARLADSPPRASLLNELAWLCARTGEKPQEGLELAKRAVAAAPGEAAYIDTLAEACYQTADFDQAVRLEQAALELQPGDPFLLEQLERFQHRKGSN